MNALRIGLFSECYRPVVNGIVASVDSLAASLRALGNDVRIVTPRVPSYVDVEPAQVIRLASLPLPTETTYRLTVPYLPKTLGDFAIVHAHSPFVTGALAAWHARRTGAPLIFTYHTRLEAYAHYVPLDARLTRAATTLVTRRFANAADAVVVPTLAMERLLREMGVRTQIFVVPSGIDVAAFGAGRRRDDVRASLGAGPGQKLALAVGRLGREKNLDVALAAFARPELADCRLAIVGDGADRARLVALAERLGLGARVTFARELPRAELPDTYASADAFVFASRSDTQGLVLAEALAAGVPIVAIDVPQTREVLRGAGSLCADDPAALAAALAHAFARPRDGAPGRERARDFDAVAVGERIANLYESLLHG